MTRFISVMVNYLSKALHRHIAVGTYTKQQVYDVLSYAAAIFTQLAQEFDPNLDEYIKDTSSNE